DMACGPKCMAFMIFMSIWGIIFLSILGGLYYNHIYQQNAYNCWVAAGGYVVVGVLAGLRLCCLGRSRMGLIKG
ncbi:hypothetical protein TELCIR_11129, partial [Teladorsagia circumcincta]